MRKPAITFCVIVLIAAVFIAADYFSLLGTSTRVISDFIELRFRMVDKETGAPVINAFAKCFQQHNQNACTQRDSGKLGIISVNVPVQKTITRSRFFIQNTKLKETLDPELQVLFFHQDYASPVETITVAELPELSKQLITIHMPEIPETRQD